MSLSTPAQLTLPFANSGVKNTIPVPSQIATDPGLASYTDGFPPATRAPVASGGKPPYGEDINGILFAVSQGLQWEQAGGRYPFSSAFATAVGGYPLSAIVQASDGTGSWLNTTANNTNDPEAVVTPNGWQPVGKRGITSVALTNANVTLTNLQSANETIVFTGVLTGNVVVTVSQFIKDYKFINQTTGAFTVSVKTPAGGALLVNQGGRFDAYGDGATLNAVASALGQGLLGAVTRGAMNIAAASASGTYTADEIIVGAALGGPVVKLGSFSQTINLGTVGAGGMDTGAAPVSGFVGLYGAYNPSTGARTIFASSAVAAALGSAYTGTNAPAGFTMTGLLTVVPTNGSSQFPILTVENKNVYFISVTVLNVTALNASFTPFNIAAAVPKNAILCSGSVQMTDTSAATLSYGIAGSSSGTGAISNTGQNTQQIGGATSAIPVIGNSQTLYYQNAASVGASITTVVAVTAYQIG